MSCDDGCNLGQRVQDPRTGFTMHLRDVRDRRIGGQRRVDADGIRRLLLAVRQDDGLAAQIPQDPHDALAIAAVVRHEHLAVPRNEGAERRFDRECAAALQRDTDVFALSVDDGNEIAAHRCGELVERAVPGSPISEHRGLGDRRSGQRTGCQQYRAGRRHCRLRRYQQLIRCQRQRVGRHWQRVPVGLSRQDLPRHFTRAENKSSCCNNSSWTPARLP